MSMRRTHDVLASTGEYKDRDGNMKKRWLRVGVIMEDERTGELAIKMEAMPVGPEWSGWLKPKRIESAGSVAGVPRREERTAADPDGGMEQEDAKW
jgi:hypothetical protein